jgi:DNA-binding MarR family transcriptional regulator
MDQGQKLFQDAETIAHLLRAVQQILRRPVAAELAGSRLTVPQVYVLSALVDADGSSVKELSERVGLAHSTVSGIVERLERRRLVQRRSNPEDRRFTAVFLSELVKSHLRDGRYADHLGPRHPALRSASEEERTQVLEGLTTLHRLLEREPSSEQA